MTTTHPSEITIGLISDTHGLLRPQALEALAAVDRIIHAGDIGGPQILERLRAIAPLDVVRGNNDTGPWAREIPETLNLLIGGLRIHVLHNMKELGAAPAGTRVIIAGHSHRPSIIETEGVLRINPGSAGPRRFSLPVSLGYLVIANATARSRIAEIL